MAITGPSDVANAGIRRLDPAKYVDLASFINEVNKPDNRELLVKTYGNQGITGFLKLTGAVKNAGTNDQVQWWEEQRLHPKASIAPTATVASAAAGASQSFVVATAAIDASASTVNLRENDVVLAGTNFDVRCFVHDVVKTGNTVQSFKLTPLASADTLPSVAVAGITVPVIGNLFAQGSDQ